MIPTLFGMAGRREPAPSLTQPQWRELLAFADRTQLSLFLRGITGLPTWLEEELEKRNRDNATRRRRLGEAFAEVSAALSAAGIEFVALKGFTHEASQSRVQYDLDLLVRPGDDARARQALQTLGYAPHGERSLSAEHSHPLVRPHRWAWRGNYFDPDMPIPVELHGSLWNPKLDRVRAAGIEKFWDRRCTLEIAGLKIPALSEPDRIAFAALHALRHILRHDARPAHVLELAQYLGSRADDAAFWTNWTDLHTPRLRTLQTVAFRFAFQWFGCGWPDAVAEEWARQPDAVIAWFREFAWSPAANLVGPNKDTVWLHLALAERGWDRFRIFCDRLAPLRLPHRDEPAPYRSRFLGRMRYHAGALAPALASGLRWWWRRETASRASHIPDWNRPRV